MENSTQKKPEKTQQLVVLGKADTNETLQTEVPCREQLFCICELKIAISGLLEWIPKGLNIGCTRSRCLPDWSGFSGLSMRTFIYLTFTFLNLVVTLNTPLSTVPATSLKTFRHSLLVLFQSHLSLTAYHL